MVSKYIYCRAFYEGLALKEHVDSAYDVNDAQVCSGIIRNSFKIFFSNSY